MRSFWFGTGCFKERDYITVVSKMYSISMFQYSLFCTSDRTRKKFV